jgi:hypothetical protein
MAGVLFGRKVNPEMIWVRDFFIGVGVKKWLYRMPNVRGKPHATAWCAGRVVQHYHACHAASAA